MAQTGTTNLTSWGTTVQPILLLGQTSTINLPSWGRPVQPILLPGQTGTINLNSWTDQYNQSYQARSQDISRGGCKKARRRKFFICYFF